MNIIPYSEALPLVQEADILLFRGKGIISWLIKRYGSGVHSHVGIAHWDNGNLQCVEFREFKGGRSVSLKTQVDNSPFGIDVFRAAKRVDYENDSYIFDDSVKSKITTIMLKLTGLPYGWKNMWKLVKHYLPFYRLAPQNIKDNNATKIFVCSTAAAYAYRTSYIDPVPYLADSAVTPSDLARSSLFEYQFTLQKDW